MNSPIIQSDPSYPVHAMGPLIAPAVVQHSSNTGVRIELAAIAGITSAAAAVQDLFNVQRPDQPASPITVLVAVSADSGAGKSTAAKPFMRPHEETQMSLDATPDQRHDAKAGQILWAEELAYLRQQLSQLVKDGASQADKDKKKDEIAAHLRTRNEAKPRLLHDHVTPAALRANLANWPSTLIVSLDAGHVLNGRLTGDFDMLNAFWDGDPIRSDTLEESFVVYEPRVSTVLFTQPAPTLRFLSRRGDDAHSTGFFARMDWAFLEPKAIQPTYAGPRSDEAVVAFQQRVKALLTRRITSRKAGNGHRHAIGFTPDADAYFRDLFRRCMAMGSAGGALQHLGGYAAKMAERAARYACILHSFNDFRGQITSETLANAEAIVMWHTHQFQKMLYLASPHTQAMHDAHLMENFIHQAVSRGEWIRLGDLERICPVEWKRSRRMRAWQHMEASGRACLRSWKRTKYVQLAYMPQFSATYDGRAVPVLPHSLR